MATRVLRDEGFTLNRRKTRVMGPRQCRRVTGLVISDGGTIGVGRKKKRALRAAMFRALNPESDLSPGDRGRLRAGLQGWLAFLDDVDAEGAAQLRRFQNALLARWSTAEAL